ncbi:MAG: EAL and HDOD domain-containing protein [Desulfovibrionaceae bacterium]
MQTSTAQTPPSEQDCGYCPVFIARQPVFDRRMETYGQWMLFRHSDSAENAVYADEYQATVDLLSSVPLAAQLVPSNGKALVHFPRRSILEGLPRALPAASTVLLVRERPGITAEYLDALASLQRDGYRVAVNDFDGRPGDILLAGLADMVCVDFKGASGLELAHWVEVARRHCDTLLAKRIETEEELASARKLGFGLFQGFFFQKPSVIRGRNLASTTLAKLRLFDLLETSEPDFDVLSQAVSADVGISYRLLNFLNSPYYGFSQKVSSVHQAVVLAGWMPVRNWLRVILLSDLAPSSKARELSYLSAHRAKFLESAARCGGHEDQADAVFTVGLFSLLDALLDEPMTEILRHLPFSAEINATLCGAPSVLEPWMELVRHIERAEWDEMGKTAQRLALPPGTVADAYRLAYQWADAFFAPPEREQP